MTIQYGSKCISYQSKKGQFNGDGIGIMIKKLNMPHRSFIEKLALLIIHECAHAIVYTKKDKKANHNEVFYATVTAIYRDNYHMIIEGLRG